MNTSRSRIKAITIVVKTIVIILANRGFIEGVTAESLLSTLSPKLKTHGKGKTPG